MYFSCSLWRFVADARRFMADRRHDHDHVGASRECGSPLFVYDVRERVSPEPSQPGRPRTGMEQRTGGVRETRAEKSTWINCVCRVSATFCAVR